MQGNPGPGSPSFETLEDKIAHFGAAEPMLRANPGGRFAFPIDPEFTNWQDEQRAWRTSVVLQDMSFHMTAVHLEGPDAVAFVASLGANSFDGFGPMQAKQLVLCNAEGHFIGDAILTCDGPGKLTVVGRPEGPGWVHYQAQLTDLDVQVTAVERPTPRLSERQIYRYQIQGPNAELLLEELNGGPLPQIKFFKMGAFGIGAHQVTALNHRMSGAAGYEFWGPSQEGEAVKDLLLEAGRQYGLHQIGGRVYATTATESGWLGGPVPAIYSGRSTESYRQWLPASSYQATASLGGSYPSSSVDDLYVTPWDVGYGFMVRFDHDFIGRASLEAMADRPHRKKVRLLWDHHDVLKIAASLLGDGERCKHMEMPVASYATYCFDEVRDGSELVGMSYYPVYSANVGGWLSLAMIDEVLAIDGRELHLTWGEEDGGSARSAVEPHVQTTVRVVVDAHPIKRD